MNIHGLEGKYEYTDVYVLIEHSMFMRDSYVRYIFHDKETALNFQVDCDHYIGDIEGPYSLIVKKES